MAATGRMVTWLGKEFGWSVGSDGGAKPLTHRAMYVGMKKKTSIVDAQKFDVYVTFEINLHNN